MNIFKMISKKSKKTSKTFWILVFIIVIGIFLRTYHFHDWMYFYPDQARDAMLVEKVVSQHTTWPLLGPIAASSKFKVGPIHYYFQIISVYIFGNNPNASAYPDLLFSILTIPLFYFFLKRYFNSNLSLALTGLYSISYFAIEFSRFAWNPNPIPFFVLLFLISFSEFLYHQEKTSWIWIFILGATLGIGIQLHTLLLIALPLTIFPFFIYTFIKNHKTSSRWFFLIIVVLTLNAGYLNGEIKNNFYNTRLLFNLSSGAVQDHKSSFLKKVGENFICSSQANMHILTSLGDKESCESYSIIRHHFRKSNNFIKQHKKITYSFYLSLIFICVSFFIFGWIALIYNFKKEEDRKKRYFLGLVILYSLISLVTMIPVFSSNMPLRYYIQLIFLPYLFLGLLFQLLSKKNIYLVRTLIGIFVIISLSNLIIIGLEAERYIHKDKSSPTYVVLGEIEPMVDYMIDNSPHQKNIYFYSSGKYMQNYFKQFFYLCKHRGVTITRIYDTNKAPSGKPLFFLWRSSEKTKEGTIRKHPFKAYKQFGQNIIYKLKN